MKDKTVVQRVRKQRMLRKADGWHEVKVWVPHEEQAVEIKELAAEYRREYKEQKRAGHND